MRLISVLLFPMLIAGAADAALFELRPQGSEQALRFLQPPDFEASRAAGDSLYYVEVRAKPRSGGLAASPLADLMTAFRLSSSPAPVAAAKEAPSSTRSKEVVVVVRNVEEVGTVSGAPLPLPPLLPRAGRVLTAVLEEGDAVLAGTTAWMWASALSAAGPWTEVSRGSGEEKAATRRRLRI